MLLLTTSNYYRNNNKVSFNYYLADCTLKYLNHLHIPIQVFISLWWAIRQAWTGLMSSTVQIVVTRNTLDCILSISKLWSGCGDHLRARGMVRI